MRMMLMLAALAGLLLAVPTTASASKRFRGCVAESSGCHHRFYGGDLPVIMFKDLKQATTAYKVCIRDPVHRVCTNRATGKKGRWHQCCTWQNYVTGKHIVRWYVKGRQVARWKFRILSEPE